jgi:RNA polymerase sigma-70 factor (ECF subfamily)
VPKGVVLTDAQKTDAEVILGSLERPEEFRSLFVRYFSPIYRYLSRRVEPATAEDIAAEVFVQAFRHRRVYDPRYPSARPWLFGIASNELRRQRRDEQRRLKAYVRAYAGECDEEEDGAVSRGDARALWPSVALALASLGAKDRDVLLLFAWAELSYDEIALALDIPVGTVRSRLSRARQRVRTALGGTSEADPEADAPLFSKEFPWMISG